MLRMNYDLLERARKRAPTYGWICCVPNGFSMFFHIQALDLWDSVSISDRGGLVPVIVGTPSNIYTELQWMVAKSCTTKRMVETL
jgi:hypothetical protein